MSTLTHEQTINTALAEVIESYGKQWKIRPEEVGGVLEDGGRPDILVEKEDGWPIVIEAEVGNHRQAEKEARSRLRRKVASTGREVHASIALVYADAIREFQGAALRKALAEAQFEYALYAVDADKSISRFPEGGWLVGSGAEVALLLHRSSIPGWRVEALADSLERGVIRAAGAFTSRHQYGSPLGETIATILGQADDEGGQTRRMAMTVIVDALVFHAALAEAEMVVPANPKRTVRAPGYFRNRGRFIPSHLFDEWELILEVNYWPIFHTSGAMLRTLPSRLAARMLDLLWETAEELIVGGVTSSHDLTGAVFQRLIADRKFLATFYTRPAAAALLAALALPLGISNGRNWADGNRLASLRIGDFACGTGTLLSTAYQRVGLLHEIHGGDPTKLHPAMMERGLVGLDVLTAAVHLTAAMLAGTYPGTPFEGECLLTMPYGRHDWGVCVGSLDLLTAQTSFDIMQAAAKTAGGRGTEEVRDLMARVGHEQFDLVIMNPPFTRHGAREGDRTHVHNPAFAAFGANEEEQDELAEHLRRLGAGGHGHGHAGLASHFVELAHRKAASGGTLALVLPLSVLSGKSWEKIRILLAGEYRDPIVVTIAQETTHTRSFSADTGMAECLFVAKKGRPVRDRARATFVILGSQPKDSLSGEQIGEAISHVIATKAVRALEDGPYGGTRLVIGATQYGEVLDSPLPSDGAWQIAGIRDMTLAQTAYQLASGRLWIEGMSVKDARAIPVSRMEEVIKRVGPHHLDLSGAKIKSDGLPQGPFEKIDGCPAGAAYPCLWNHNAPLERSISVNPDSHCRLREVRGKIPPNLVRRAERRWETASRIHYNLDLQFNAQSIIACMTEMPSLGGRAWPTIIVDERICEHAFVLWCNSTLGLICHWWMANKTQAGRGTSTVTSIPSFYTLNLGELSRDQQKIAQVAVDGLHGVRLLPFDQMDEDAARRELDRTLLEDVLGLPTDLCQPGGPMERLRAKIASEPQIHGGKKSRVVFTPDGEQRVDR